jgi:hypothetical protein
VLDLIERDRQLADSEAKTAGADSDPASAPVDGHDGDKP